MTMVYPTSAGNILISYTTDLRLFVQRCTHAPPWDQVRRTPGWDVVHAFGAAVEKTYVVQFAEHVNHPHVQGP